MKRVFLFGAGLADDPVAELDGRTPLEAAKTPYSDEIARSGVIGTVMFVPNALPVSPDIACMAALGYDPLQHYTGRAPLDAAACGIQQTDHEVAFRCDLVTASEDVLVDATGGSITAKESEHLLSEIGAALKDKRFRLYPAGGHRNILIVDDPERVEELDDLDTTPPSRVTGERYAKHLPRGRAEAMLADFIKRSREVLENNEINRVRIDLNENPANLAWPWGQGKRPKLTPFTDKRGGVGAVVTDAEFVKGLARCAGMAVETDLAAAIARYDFVFVYFPGKRDFDADADLKAKVRRIEEFDLAVGNALRALKAGKGEWRLAVATDMPHSFARNSITHGPVPAAVAGTGISSSGQAGFGEKAAAAGKPLAADGYRFLDLLFS